MNVRLGDEALNPPLVDAYGDATNLGGPVGNVPDSIATGQSSPPPDGKTQTAGAGAQEATAARMASTVSRSSRASSECLRKATPRAWPSPAYDGMKAKKVATTV